MSLLHPIDQQTLNQNFVYKAKLAGIAPVYVGRLDQDAPNLAAQNGCPEWVLDATLLLCQLAERVNSAMRGPESRGFPLHIYARIDGAPLKDDAALKEYE